MAADELNALPELFLRSLEEQAKANEKFLEVIAQHAELIVALSERVVALERQVIQLTMSRSSS